MDLGVSAATLRPDFARCDLLVDAPRNRIDFHPFVVALLLRFAVDSVELDVRGNVCLHLGKKNYRKFAVPESLPGSSVDLFSSGGRFVPGCVPRTIQFSSPAEICCVESEIFFESL